MMTEKKYCRKNGFTLVEILTVVFIIAILLGVLMPAMNMVRKTAKDVQEKAQMASIDIGLNLYKNESCFGDYPQSRGYNETGAAKYCGAQTLSEAMFGQDLLGVDPNTSYAVGTGTPPYAPEYDFGNPAYNLDNRKGPYLDRTHISVMTAQNIYDSSASAIEPDLFLICDVYARAKKYVTLPNGNSKKVAISTPILYYKANISKTNNNDLTDTGTDNNIYDSQDNEKLIGLKSLGVEKTKLKHHFDQTYTEERQEGATVVTLNGRQIFYEFISDPMTSTTTPLINRPVRPDSFLLISAGSDGLYGTSDDICNFEPNIE
ncbi:MAG: type II secretion system GspH family protein [Planctomycetaceae bacterium]|nr:type II secretion system GspH family protein [Planctomycetaceae bacterium]